MLRGNVGRNQIFLFFIEEYLLKMGIVVILRLFFIFFSYFYEKMDKKTDVVDFGYSPARSYLF